MPSYGALQKPHESVVATDRVRRNQVFTFTLTVCESFVS